MSASRRPTHAANLAILGETLRISCVELLADYGLAARPAQGDSQQDPLSTLVAGVDFSGRAVRGTVALSAAKRVILQTVHAAAGLDANASNLPDWTCELANQLLGRVKNKLRVYEVSLNMNVPRLLAGAELKELDAGICYRFSCDFGALSASLDVMTAPGLVLQRREPEAPLAQEGDFLLF